MTERPLVESTFTEQDLEHENIRLQQEVAQLQQTVAQLRYALDHRPHTDRVVGMIMLVASCGEEAAWAMLARVSQDTNRKAREVATLISAQVAAGHGLPPDLMAGLRDVLPPSSSRRRSAGPPGSASTPML